MIVSTLLVIPAQAGTHGHLVSDAGVVGGRKSDTIEFLGSRLRGNDGEI